MNGGKVWLLPVLMVFVQQVVRAFGMLYKRLGKRRLKALDVKDEHPLIVILHNFRCASEGIK